MVTEIRQGDTYWIDFGAVDGSAPAYRHPCVVVQSDIFNRSPIATTVVCLITSNMRRGLAPGNVALRKGEGSLPKPCVVNISQVMTVDKGELTDRIGKLPSSTLDTIRQGLHLLIDRE